MINKNTLAVIGVGNMAKSIISGIISSDVSVSEIILFDKNSDQYSDIKSEKITITVANSIPEAVINAEYVLLSVKPQNYPEVLEEIGDVDGFERKKYISIGAGITSDSVSMSLNSANVIRVLPNLPMLIGEGTSVICENNDIDKESFEFVCDVFKSAGSIMIIDESEMNRTIGVTSSSPAYVFKFINAIYKGALAQKISDNGLLDAICDTVIGSARLLKMSADTPETLISKVASKGGTTEQALNVLNREDFDKTIEKAMIACTKRADELGNTSK